MLAVTLTFLAMRSPRRPLILGWGAVFGFLLILGALVVVAVGIYNPVIGYQRLPYPNNLQLINPNKPIILVQNKDKREPNQISPNERVLMPIPKGDYLVLEFVLPNAFDALQGLWRGRDGMLVVDGIQRGKFNLNPGNQEIYWEGDIQNLERKVSPTAELILPIKHLSPTDDYEERTLIVRFSMNVVFPDTIQNGEITNKHKTLKHQFQIVFLTPEEIEQYQQTKKQARVLELRFLFPFYASLFALGMLMLIPPLYLHWAHHEDLYLLPPHTPTDANKEETEQATSSEQPTVPTHRAKEKQPPD